MATKRAGEFHIQVERKLGFWQIRRKSSEEISEVIRQNAGMEINGLLFLNRRSNYFWYFYFAETPPLFSLVPLSLEHDKCAEYFNVESIISECIDQGEGPYAEGPVATNVRPFRISGIDP